MNNKARIPVRPLSYADRDIALTRELVIDYGENGDIGKGHIYITDKDDPSILIDITKMIADSYLQNINGDNTTVTINNEVYNLSELLGALNKSKITILNTADSVGVPADINYDHKSITVEDKVVSIYGFNTAPNNSILKKVDGTVVWSTEEGEDLEPHPGDYDNVITIIPTNDKIVLYAKTAVYTELTATLYPVYTIEMPTSLPRYFRFAWKLDSKVDSEIKFPSNIVWITDEVTSIIEDKTYIFNIETWDYGHTWIISATVFDKITGSI